MPMGTCTPVANGYRISGQWNYCSGIPYASHFIGGSGRIERMQRVEVTGRRIDG